MLGSASRPTCWTSGNAFRSMWCTIVMILPATMMMPLSKTESCLKAIPAIREISTIQDGPHSGSTSAKNWQSICEAKAYPHFGGKMSKLTGKILGPNSRSTMSTDKWCSSITYLEPQLEYDDRNLRRQNQALLEQPTL